MKPRQILAICAVMAAVIILVLLLPRPTGQHNSSPAKDPQPALASAPKASIQSTVATSKAKIDDIFFLNEGTSGFESLAAKKTTVVKRMPNATGNRRIVDSRSITTPAEGTFIAPRWSPDGLELLFSKAGYEGLYKKGTIGGDLGVVTSKENVGYGAVWNKDGSIDTKTNKGETQKFNPDGSPVESPNVVADDPSQTGAFTKDDGVYYRANPGEAAVPIALGEDRFYGGTVSPDGKYIVYNGLSTGIYIAPLDGSSPPVSLGQGHSPSWLPDGSGIVYSVLEDDGHNVVAGDLFYATKDGSSISNLTQTPNQIENYPAVSPDGSTIAFESDGAIQLGTFH